MATASAIAIKHAEEQARHADAQEAIEQRLAVIEGQLTAILELLTAKTGEGGEAAAPAKTAKK